MRRPTSYKVLRDLDETYAGHPIAKGAVVYECSKCTYGCISCHGIAVTFNADGDYPFFEIGKEDIIPIWD